MLHLAAGGDLPTQWNGLEPSGSGALQAVVEQLNAAEPTPGENLWISHAHLDLAWLWPVADTWQAAERTLFISEIFCYSRDKRNFVVRYNS